ADHQDATTLNLRSLAATYRLNRGHVAAAIIEYERLLTDTRRLLGPDHPHTLTTRYNLAGAYFDSWLVSDAITEWRSLFADARNVLDRNPPPNSDNSATPPIRGEQHQARTEEDAAEVGPQKQEATPIGQRAADHRDRMNSAATSSAICAVFSAAPLRRLSPVTKKFSARGSSSARRIRPTHAGSVPAASIGIGYSSLPGSSTTMTPGAFCSTSRASSASTSLANTACTATEWHVTTGTRTHVAVTLRSGSPRIFRVSLRILSSSEDQPASRSDPDHGTTFNASGAGNGPRSSPTACRTSPGREPSIRSPATLVSCSCNVSMPSWPAPDTA